VTASVHNPSPEPSPRRTTVLVVEDEVMVRLLVAEDLRESGFVVIEAANADEALTVLQSSTDIDVMLTDIRMPGARDGLALAAEARAAWPGLKIIIASAFFPRRPRPEIVDAIFTKPYDTLQLVRRIRELIPDSSR
jgi:CheY-like chemotaxis protein